MNNQTQAFKLTVEQIRDGWITWFGGDNPLPGKSVQVMIQCGTTTSPCKSDILRWAHEHDSKAIVAYRIVLEVPAGYRELTDDEKRHQPVEKAMFCDYDRQEWSYGVFSSQLTYAYPWRRVIVPVKSADPYRELKQAYAQGSTIEVFAGDKWWPMPCAPDWDQPADKYRVAQPVKQVQCKLRNDISGFRPLRDPEQWLAADAWKPYMLEPGLRPLLVGEPVRKGDQVVYPSGLVNTLKAKSARLYNDAPTIISTIRTRRPLPLLTAQQREQGWKRRHNRHNRSTEWDQLNPVPGEWVKVMYADGSLSEPGPSNEMFWGSSGTIGDVVAYVVVENPNWELSDYIEGFQPLSAGVKWHRNDWTQKMLPKGYRPLIKGERRRLQDEMYDSTDDEWVCFADQDWSADGIVTMSSMHTRTKRPLPRVVTLTDQQIADGWNIHTGDTNPAPGAFVDIRFANGVVNTNITTNLWRWTTTNTNGDIVAYRVVLNAQQVKDGWLPHDPKHGFPNGLSNKTRVNYILRDRTRMTNADAGSLVWGLIASVPHLEIVAYQPVPLVALTSEDVRCGDEVKHFITNDRFMIDAINSLQVHLATQGWTTYNQLLQQFSIRRHGTNDFTGCHK